MPSAHETNGNAAFDSTVEQELNLKIYGQVQGVGFRPLLYRLAHLYQQTGFVANTPKGVHCVLQGNAAQQQQLLAQLQQHPPARAQITQWDISTQHAPKTYIDFQILDSLSEASPSAFIAADLAPCKQCVEDIQNPNSRFYQYPFTSCCDCGPRFSILKALPFDRAHTSMADFKFCAACENSYHDPLDRRFHAQTLCCPVCGPQLSFMSANGVQLADGQYSLPHAVTCLQAGQIVAIKGIGGFQLCVAANQTAAVHRLRERKQRLHKPLAVMVANLAAAQALCHINSEQEQLLQSPQAPIVLLRAKPNNGIAINVSQESTWLGIMLPASPLHTLLANAVSIPLVVTSGNVQGEPLCTENIQALSRLATIADYFLLHNRSIQRPLDDSVVKWIAPTMISAPAQFQPTLALGGHFANSIAMNIGKYWLNSAHIGDLENTATRQQLHNTLTDLQQLYPLPIQHWVHDLHPDYFSSRLAQSSIYSTGIAHHYAHVLACMAEHELKPPVLGFAWDGTGLNAQGALCGSEVLLIEAQGYQRLAQLRPFALPGGDSASGQIHRVAFALLWQLRPDVQSIAKALPHLTGHELTLLEQMLRQNLNCPLSSSAGRLFDAIASLLNLTQANHFQGQAAMQLEQLADQSDDDTHYPFTISDDLPALIDWHPLIEAILDDLPQCPPASIAARFHNTLAHILVQIASRAGVQSVVFSGGCFQNANLTNKAVQLMQQAGFTVFRHSRVPPNDGGLALGQLYGYYLEKVVTI